MHCCSLLWFVWILLMGIVRDTRSVVSFRCYFINTRQKYEYAVIPLKTPEALMKPSCIDVSRPTIFYVFGYRGRPDGPATTRMMATFVDTGKLNVISIDWEEESKPGTLGVALGYLMVVLPNVKMLGQQLGHVITKLSGLGLDMDKVHLVGHSLGAQLVAFTGRQIIANGKLVGRITGLDPPRALYEGIMTIQNGLDHTCAKFVDIIHTDPGGYGISLSVGTVDIWCNYGQRGGVQPGCPTEVPDPRDSNDACDHDRVWQYFSESIRNPTAFEAIAAPNFKSWLSGKVQMNRTIFMGVWIDTSARGNFYLSTNSKAPFGKGKAGLKPGKQRTPQERKWRRFIFPLKYI